ncbi:hypothetical protein BU17DRAFT_38359 [Hysterangium stoloniferum]|nr:hypothetical protein BU17DRAFT_38359 [Hysterangium stoloniferum]
MSYYTSSRHSSGYDSRPRGYRVCDNCGTVESSQIQLKICGSCKVTQYCSRDCQRAHWKFHEALCKHTQSTIKSARNHYDRDSSTARSASDSSQPVDISKHLRRFTSAHSTLFGWAGFQALELKRIPSNIRKSALLIELTWRGGSDTSRRFEVVTTHLVPLSILASDPVVCADIQRREDRSRRSGGIGAAVVILQCGRISQVMPVEVDSPAKVPWATMSDWEDFLSRWIDCGSGPFEPP